LAKKKLVRWAELKSFSHVLQPAFEDVFRKDYELKGRWHTEWFGNNNPIVLELGCGKGEYTVGLAEKYPGKNFIGIDIKGHRMWRGAKEAKDKGLQNVTFLRTRIEFITSFFALEEIDEIWITFPDPQLKQRKEKKRLPGPYFLNLYRTFLKKNGIVHLKTDCRELFDYTLTVVKANNLEILTSTADLYNELPGNELLSIHTFYEEMFLKENVPITYLSFRLDNEKVITGSEY
jgi:tRNA (guanine-N7-)-methyltransferase